MQSRKPPNRELEPGKSPAASSLQVIYPLLWVCFPSCTRTANPAAFPEGSVGAAPSNLSLAIGAPQWYIQGDLWGPWQAESGALPWRRGQGGVTRSGRSGGGPRRQRWRAQAQPETPHASPTRPSRRVPSVSEAEGFGLRGPCGSPDGLRPDLRGAGPGSPVPTPGGGGRDGVCQLKWS